MPDDDRRVTTNCVHCFRVYVDDRGGTSPACPDCEAAGHRDSPLTGCPACDPVAVARLARVEAALASCDPADWVVHDEADCPICTRAAVARRDEPA